MAHILWPKFQWFPRAYSKQKIDGGVCIILEPTQILLSWCLAISKATSTSIHVLLDAYLQENLGPLLCDTITKDILPSILHTLQSFRMETRTLVLASTSAMEPTIGTKWHTPV